VKPPRIGVLALQGAFREHIAALERVGADAIPLRSPGELDVVDAVVLPGGESTTMDKLLRKFELQQPLRAHIEAGLPVMATCAGVILLARDVRDLVRAEFAFAATQLQTYGRGLAKTFVYLGAAALFGLVAFLVLTAFLVALLDLVMPLAASTMIIAVVYAIVAAICAAAGMKKVRALPPPDFSAVAENVKEDLQWTRMQVAAKTK